MNTMHLWHDIRTYPVSIFEDRYTGVYSGGTWVAVAQADQVHSNGKTRYDIVFDGTHNDDISAGTFGNLIDDIPWIAVGNSPNEAYENLVRKQDLERSELK